MREVLVDGADDSGIAGILEETERVPEAKGGLQRAGVGVQGPALRVGLPATRPQGAEVASAAPQPGAPLAKVEVPVRVVDPGGLPVDDPG